MQGYKIFIVLSTILLLGPLTHLSYAQTLSVDSNTFNFISPTEDDFDNGLEEATLATQLTISSSSNWTVTIKTDSTNMGGYGKPISDFHWRKNGNPTYQAITNEPQTLDTGSSGEHSVDVDYKVALDWTQDSPNTYSIVLTYTLTTP